jgi:hypothetical protein
VPASTDLIDGGNQQVNLTAVTAGGNNDDDDASPLAMVNNTGDRDRR